MKLSPETIELLNNFSNINNSIVISPGNVIKTINSERNLFAKATVQETFPRDIPIYELKQFLNIFRIHKNPDVDFSNEHYIIVQQGPTRMKFYYADLYALNKSIDLPTKEYVPNDIVLSVELNSEHIDQVKKAANMYNLLDLSLIGKEGRVELMVHNKNDPTSKAYNIEIGTTNHEFSFNFIEKIVMILPGSYNLEIFKASNNGFCSRFVKHTQVLEYFIALESDSFYG